MYGTRDAVYEGTAVSTKHGLRRDDLFKGKNGRIWSQKEYQKMKKHGRKNLGIWTACLYLARWDLGTRGFVAVKKGTELYNLTKEFYTKAGTEQGTELREALDEIYGVIVEPGSEASDNEDDETCSDASNSDPPAI